MNACLGKCETAASTTRGESSGSAFVIAVGLCAVFLSLGCACTSRPQVQPPEVPPPEVMPGYSQLVARYNANIDRLDRMWCAADVEMGWRDEDGKKHEESGDGHLMMVLPDQFAMSISKMGTRFWVGCDAKRYWLLDLRKKKDRTAYFGRRDRAELSTGRNLPLAVRAAQLPLLLGLLKLDPDPDVTPLPAVTYREGAFVIEPPGIMARISIDPKTALSVSVEMLDAKGTSLVVSSLSREGRVALDGVVKSDWPRIRTRISLELSESGERLALKLSRMTDARGRSDKRKQKAIVRALDFEYLTGRYHGIKLVDHDDQSARP